MAATPESSAEQAAPSLGPVRLPSAFRSLINRNFRFLWFGQVSWANAMQTDMVARSWLIWELTHSTSAIAGVNAARAVPLLTLGLFGGVVADRFNRQKLLMLIQAWGMTMHLTMAALILSGNIQVWHVYAIAVGTGTGMALNQPVRTSMVANLVERKEMVNALTLNSIAMNCTRLVLPSLITQIIYFAGTGWAYVFSSAAWGVAMWTTTRIHLPSPSSLKSRSGPLAQLMEGFKYMGQNRLVLALVLLGLAPLAIGFSHQTLLPQLVEDDFGKDARLYGYILSTGAIGGLAGGLIIASKRDLRNKGMLMLIASGGYTVALFGFAAIAQVSIFFLVFPMIIMIGASQTVFRSLNTATLMETTPDHLRGRISSTTLIDTALAPLAGLAAGYMADSAGVSSGYALLGGGCVVVIVLVLLLYPKMRKV